MEEVLLERRGALGLITLNRPQALNALTLDMIHAMTSRLEEWAGDPAVGGETDARAWWVARSRRSPGAWIAHADSIIASCRTGSRRTSGPRSRSSQHPRCRSIAERVSQRSRFR